MIKRSIFAFGLISFTIIGCSPAFLDKTPGTTFGTIVVKSPIVSTRERLVNDRYDQDAWLRGQLDAVNFAHFGFDALSDVRSFVGQFSRAGVNFRSQALAPKVAGDDDASKEKPEAPSTGLGVKSDDIVKADTFRKKGTDTVDTFTVSPQDLARTQGQASPKDVFRDRRDLRGEIRNEILENQLDDRHDLGGRTLHRLSFDATVKADADTSAWAEVSFEIMEPSAGSDCDSAKLNQNRNLDNAAKKQLCEKEYYGELYRNWGRFLEEELQKQLSRRIFSYNTDTQTPGQIKDLLRYYFTKVIYKPQYLRRSFNPNSPLVSELHGFGKNPSQFLRELESQNAKPGKADLEDFHSFKKIIEHLRKIKYYNLEDEAGQVLKYEKPLSINLVAADFIADQLIDQYSIERRLGKYIGIQWLNYSGTGIGSEFPKLVVCDARRCNKVFIKPEYFEEFRQDEGPAAAKCFESGNTCFKDFIVKLKSKSQRFYSYSVTPKEAVQRISDVATRRRAAQLLLSLGLQFKEIGIDAVSNSIKENQGIFQTINRLPIVVGYGDQARQFGWIIGPKFNIGQKSKNVFGFLGFGTTQPTVNYRHTQVQKRLTAVLSVPAWWDEIILKSTTEWRKEGRSAENAGLVTGGTKDKEMHVDVRPRMDAITTALTDDLRPIGPVIDSETKPIDLIVGRPESVVIRGDDLWRSTKVTIGNQVSRKITVLPDMRGIIAEFDAIKAPVDWTDRSRPYGRKQDEELSVTVWTSESHVDLPNGAVIHPVAKQAALAGQVRVKGRTIIRGGDKKVKVGLSAPTQLTERQGGMKIGIRVKDSGGTYSRVWKTADGTSGQNLALVSAELTLEDADWQDVSNGLAIEAALFVKPRQGASETVHPALGDLIYYATPEDAQVRLVSNNEFNAAADKLEAPVKFSLPENMKTAFPGVSRSGLRITAKSPVSGIKLGFKDDGITADGKFYAGTLTVVGDMEAFKNATSISVSFKLPTEPAGDYPEITGTLAIAKEAAN